MMEETKMKFLIFLFMLIYLVSPIDVAPGIPVDDIIVTIGSTVYMLTPKEE